MISEPAFDRLNAMFRHPDVSGTRYQLVSIIGRGGMGVVYTLARDTSTDATHAERCASEELSKLRGTE